MPEPMMTSKEIAAWLRLSPKWGHQTVEKMAREGKIYGVKIGDLWRFPREQALLSLSMRHQSKKRRNPHVAIPLGRSLLRVHEG